MRLAIPLILALGMTVVQSNRVLAQDQEPPLLCPSTAPGTPQLEWLQGAVRIMGPGGSGLTNPQLIKTSKPELPPIAKAAGVKGQVLLDARVDTDGRVRNMCVVASVPLLDAEAAKALKKFEFVPAKRDGVPVPAIVRIEFGFGREK